MYALILGTSLLVVSGFIIPMICAKENDDDAFTTVFYHLATLWCYAGTCVMIKTWSDYHMPHGSKMRSEVVHRRCYGLGTIGLIICLCFQLFAFYYIHWCFWTGYTIYMIFHVISFGLLRFALFPGVIYYGIQFKRYMEYFLFIILATGVTTEVLNHFMAFERSWAVLIPYNAAISIMLVELHAISDSEFQLYYDDIDENRIKFFFSE